VSSYLPRLVDPLLDELISAFPAVTLVGPRAAGKTTTARRHARTVFELDRRSVATAFRSDPDAMLSQQDEPILLDEWQNVPDVLGAVKRAVDADPRPGRFLLTGSVRAELKAQTWPGTGRVVDLPMTALTAREICGRASGPGLIERLVQGDPDAIRAAAEPPNLRDYVDMALSGAFPQTALQLPRQSRRRWLRAYVRQMLTHDIPELEPRRAPELLGRFFRALALNTAGVVELSSLTQMAQIDRKTATAYEHLFSDLYILDMVPAWFTNHLKRLNHTPKRYLVDPALAAAVTSKSTAAVLADPDLLGRLMDTFVAAQLRAELPLADFDARLFHLRQDGGRREIDILVEIDCDAVIAIEVKATANPGRSAARHLMWLRDELGDRFIHGLLLTSAPLVWTIDDRITAAPISALWEG
jgi:predicted AAA+ superfamily ATPase